jgi:hypothetical protein
MNSLVGAAKTGRPRTPGRAAVIAWWSFYTELARETEALGVLKQKAA